MEQPLVNVADIVKLYNEFEEKAKNNIIEKIIVSDNVINGIAVMTSNNPSLSIPVIMVKFKLNEKDYYKEITIPSGIYNNIEELYRQFYKLASEEIAKMFLSEVVKYGYFKQ
jgi:hypothetical protein